MHKEDGRRLAGIVADRQLGLFDERKEAKSGIAMPGDSGSQ